MFDFASVEKRLGKHLSFRQRPVAISFLAAEPAGVTRFIGAAPSGCSFWRLAANGSRFYTLPADHYNCPIGSYTHGIDLPPEREGELGGTLQLMAQAGYLRMEEVPGIPRVERAPVAILYEPLAESRQVPDAVILALRPTAMMLLQEAAIRAGVASPAPALARPTCMAIPAAMQSGTVTSMGCAGNRIYTELPDDELYVFVRGSDLAVLADALDTVVRANATLRQYHDQRLQAIGRPS